jgi:hypothetical protein
MFRKSLIAGMALAILAGPAFTAAAQERDRDGQRWYVVKMIASGECHVTNAMPGAGQQMIGIPHRGNAAANFELASDAACAR